MITIDELHHIMVGLRRRKEVDPSIDAWIFVDNERDFYCEYCNFRIECNATNDEIIRHGLRHLKEKNLTAFL